MSQVFSNFFWFCMINKNVVDFTALSRTFYYCACNPWNLLWRCQYELNTATAAPTIFYCCFFSLLFITSSTIQSSTHWHFPFIYFQSIFFSFRNGFQFLHLQMCKRKITYHTSIKSISITKSQHKVHFMLSENIQSTNLKCARNQLNWLTE